MPASLSSLRSDADRLFDSGDFASALQKYAMLARSAPSPGLMVNVGYCHLMLDNASAAAISFEAALDAAPTLVQAWVGLGDAAAAINDHVKAVGCYDAALRHDQGMAVARNNRAQSLTALGRLAEAWRDAEARYSTPGASSLYPHALPLPRWDGAAGKRVLVHWEQGYGDIVQHARFLPLLPGQCASCAFECPPPLAALFRRSFPTLPMIVATNDAPDTAAFDCVAPLLSLPVLLGADARNLPPTPYLRSNRNAAASDGMRPGRTGQIRVGIVWRASAFDTRRSLSLAQLLAALSTADRHALRLVSLQHAPSADERSLLAQAGAVDAGSTLHDFDATARAIEDVDLVITVDTVVAHLAGALDHPVWLLLNEPAATRWMLERRDSPWYGSMRIFRKPATGAWAHLLADVAHALHAHCEGRAC